MEKKTPYGKLFFISTGNNETLDIPILEEDFKKNSILKLKKNDPPFLIIGSKIKSYKFFYFKCLFKSKLIYIKSVFFDKKEIKKDVTENTKK